MKRLSSAMVILVAVFVVAAGSGYFSPRRVYAAINGPGTPNPQPIPSGCSSSFALGPSNPCQPGTGGVPSPTQSQPTPVSGPAYTGCAAGYSCYSPAGGTSTGACSNGFGCGPCYNGVTFVSCVTSGGSCVGYVLQYGQSCSNGVISGSSQTQPYGGGSQPSPNACVVGTANCINGICITGYVANGAGGCGSTSTDQPQQSGSSLGVAGATCAPGTANCIGGYCLAGYMSNAVGLCSYTGTNLPQYVVCANTGVQVPSQSQCPGMCLNFVVVPAGGTCPDPPDTHSR